MDFKKVVGSISFQTYIPEITYAIIKHIKLIIIPNKESLMFFEISIFFYFVIEQLPLYN